MNDNYKGDVVNINKGVWYTFVVRGLSSALQMKVVEDALRSHSELAVNEVVFNVNDRTISVKTMVPNEETQSLLSRVILSSGFVIENDSFVKSKFLIEGMSCVSCATRIESTISSLCGVEKMSISFATMTCIVIHNARIITATQIMNAICERGYKVTLEKFSSARMSSTRAIERTEVQLMVGGMSCTSCATRIETCVRRLNGVKDCIVNSTAGRCTVTLEHADILKKVEEAIVSLGYVVFAADNSTDEEYYQRTKEALNKTQEISEHKRRFIWAAVLATPLAIVMLLMVTTNLLKDPYIMMLVNIMQLGLTTPLVFVYGSVFFVRAWQSLKHRMLTMDTLVAIGVGSSYIYSLGACGVMILTGQHMTTYFDTAGMLLAFMLLGRYLEARAKRRTNEALIELLNLVPPVSIILTANGDMTVPSSCIKKGARVRVLVGDRIPVDGCVVEGMSDVDERTITGEVLPRAVQPGSTVVGGTTNLTAMLVIEAKKVGDETMLSQILHVVQEAQNSRPEIQRIADQVAAYFVPFVICFSLTVFTVWWLLGVFNIYPRKWRGGEESTVMFAFDFFIASIVAACPCALGLATPTAIMVGTGVGAGNGILVKSGTTLELMRQSRCVIFDKTGTITTGHLRILFQKCWGDDSEKLLLMFGIVERHSNHPVAKAVASGILPVKRYIPYEVVSSKTYSGLGVEAILFHRNTNSKTTVHIGNLAMMREANVEVPVDVLDAVHMQGSLGRTAVIGAFDGIARIVVALSDEPKEEAFGVVRFLQKRGFRVLMVTGDSTSVAARVATAVGILPEDVHAEALPLTKANIVQRLQLNGHHVIFVGDGINDSPALAQADVGVALGAGTEIALEAADVVLVRNNLVDLLNLRSLSIATVHRVYGNFIWAFGYNMIILPLASGMFYPLLRVKLPPVVAGAAMVFSSLSVLLSSLSIKCFTPYRQERFIEYS